ncbi:hypothetical protein TNCT_441611 [Trichonephila clavata]|uniref:Uncharacterized protein n=1 Tax=Trichonephila clavata TaxID=2740835 RepID=A0A8X6F8J3_TRICU|nr:hypothetical protein TNCT_441611 [Trichonephila clavata]
MQLQYNNALPLIQATDSHQLERLLVKHVEDRRDLGVVRDSNSLQPKRILLGDRASQRSVDEQANRVRWVLSCGNTSPEFVERKKTLLTQSS